MTDEAEDIMWRICLGLIKRRIPYRSIGVLDAVWISLSGRRLLYLYLREPGVMLDRWKCIARVDPDE
jgi:hypothetical protein